MFPWGEKEIIFLSNPTVHSHTTNENRDSGHFDFINEDKRPLVIILAWTSAIKKHMRLYSKIYEDEGYITLTSIWPIMVTFWQHDKIHGLAQKLVNTLKENNLCDRPTIIQIFSNGGAIQYEFFRKALTQNCIPLNIKGVIFDSSPAKLNLKNYSTAIHIIRGGTSEAKSVLMTASMMAGWKIRNFLKYLSNEEYFVLDLWESLKNEENICPQHFIYSRADVVAPYQEIEAFANHRKLLGVRVTTTVFDKSPHIRHLQYEKINYKKSVLNFVRECLSNNQIYRMERRYNTLTSKL